MKEWKVILAALVIFGAGVATGALVVNLSRKPPRAQNHFVGPPPNLNAKPPWHEQRYEFVRRAERQLDLTPEQRQRIDGLVRDSQERTKNLWESLSPKLQEEMRKVRDQVRDVLTPDQKKRFEEMNTKARPKNPEDRLWKDDRRGMKPPFPAPPSGDRPMPGPNPDLPPGQSGPQQPLQTSPQ